MDSASLDALISWREVPPLGPETSYHYGPGALQHGVNAVFSPQALRRSVIIADAQVWRLHGERVLAVLEGAGGEDAARGLASPRVVVLVEPGEASKTRAEKARLEDAIFAAGVERGDVVVAVGGGVVLDLAGFTAATCLRGLRLVNVATSLLAAVDAGLGGKTAVNTPTGKNLCGAFHWPRAVICDPSLLQTLPAEEVPVGLAEMIKHAVIEGEALFAPLERELARSSLHFRPVDISRGKTDSSPPVRAEHRPSPPFSAFDERRKLHRQLPPNSLIVAVAKSKLAVVGRDPFEGGERRSLNFGHTVAHALEAASSYRLSHGEAVALGMLVEARLAVELLDFPRGDLRRLEALIAAAGLPLRPGLPFEEAWPWMRRDKKTRQAQVRMSLPLRIGAMDEADGAWARPVSRDRVEAAWLTA